MWLYQIIFFMVHLKKNLAVFCFVISFVISNVSWAQQLAGGEASLTIQMGKTERKFIFLNTLPMFTL